MLQITPSVSIPADEIDRLTTRVAELERPQEAREPFSERLKRNG